MDPITWFKKEKEENIIKLGTPFYKNMGVTFARETSKHNYSYHFTWMGRPIIQYPQDMIAMQEIIWEVQPDLIIETGIAHGGSLIFYASLLELIGKGEVLGIDIDIREHNKKEIKTHPMFKRISMLEGSSVDERVAKEVHKRCVDKKSIMVCLDSNHTAEHVLSELEIYSQYVSKGSYIVVFDTMIEYVGDDMFPNRPWKKGNSPKTAVDTFLEKHDEFEVDVMIDNKLVVSVAPSGYLKRVK